jgi:NAD(P)-dependent dehydrogenase (short-subunit alcohol dehydrogenase family)
MKRLGVPEDLAKPIVFVCSDAASYMSGFDMEITGGKYAAQNTDWPWERLSL